MEKQPLFISFAIQKGGVGKSNGESHQFIEVIRVNFISSF